MVILVAGHCGTARAADFSLAGPSAGRPRFGRVLGFVLVKKPCRVFFHKCNIYQKSDKLAKTNFQYEKRQKDLEKKRKKEEKLKKKLDKNSQPEPGADQPVPEGEAAAPDETK